MRKICSLYLVFIIVSFIGYLYEFCLAYMLEYDLDRNFLNVPLCPIYGVGVLLSYLMFSTPKEMRIIKYRIKYNNRVKIYLYFLLTAISATLLEYVIGTVFEILFNKELWNYGELLFTFNKYCSLIPSIGWGLLITIFMNVYFNRLYNKFYSIKYEYLLVFSISTFLIIFIDFLFIIF